MTDIFMEFEEGEADGDDGGGKEVERDRQHSFRKNLGKVRY